MEKMFAVSNLMDDVSFNLKVGHAVVLTAKDMPGLATMLSQVQSIRDMVKSHLTDEYKGYFETIWESCLRLFTRKDKTVQIEESIREYLEKVGSGMAIAFAVIGTVADIKDFEVSNDCSGQALVQLTEGKATKVSLP